MATGKLSIRQKMINMMYLVLLAILALNVSAEVLKAFYMMEVSMKKTGENIDAKNNLILQSFARLMENQPDRTKEWNEKAKEGQKITDEYVKYLEVLKKQLADVSGGRIVDDNGRETEIKNSDNIEKHANYMLNQGKATELKEKINATRDKLIGLIPKEDRGNIKTDMFTPDEGAKSWENAMFEGVPIAAVMASITKLQNDCKNTYGDVLNVLYNKVGSEVPVNTLRAKIVPKSTAVMVGDKFEADIFLTAYDTKQATEVVLNGQTYTAENGVLNYTLPASGQGEHKLQGIIKVREQNGIKEYPFETEYNVFSGFAAVSADAMSVMYIGVDNPVSISVPGVPTDKVIATITNGTLSRDRDNKYKARVTTRGTATINISVREEDGSVKSFGSFPFKVKEFPRPLPQIGNLDPSAYPTSTLQLYSMLNAVPPFDVGFAGVKYTITEYKCYIKTKNDFKVYDVKGQAFPEEMKAKIKTLKRDDMILFTAIKASTPSGIVLLRDASYTIR